jgi:hypothetical protein
VKNHLHNSLRNKTGSAGKRKAASKVSAIVTGLLAESKNGAMLVRLQEKLGKTKKEIYKIVSEL